MSDDREPLHARLQGVATDSQRDFLQRYLTVDDRCSPVAPMTFASPLRRWLLSDAWPPLPRDVWTHCDEPGTLGCPGCGVGLDPHGPNCRARKPEGVVVIPFYYPVTITTDEIREAANGPDLLGLYEDKWRRALERLEALPREDPET